MRGKGWSIYLTAIFLFFSCSVLRIEVSDYKRQKENYIASLKSFPKTPEGEARRDYQLNTLRFFQIVNDTMYHMLLDLDAYKDTIQIGAIVDSFWFAKDYELGSHTPCRKEGNYWGRSWRSNEYWEKMWVERAGYCDENFKYGFGLDYWDQRAWFVLKKGIPIDSRWVDDVPCWKDQSITGEPTGPLCSLNILGWTDREEICFEFKPGEAHPHRTIPSEKDRFGKVTRSEALMRHERTVAEVISKPARYNSFEDVGKILKASLHISVFPERSHKNTIWLSAGIPLEQFKPDSSGSVCFNVETVIYDEPSSSVVLETRGKPIRIFQGPDIAWYPLYKSYHLPEGKYKLVFTIRDSSKGLGSYSTEFQVPPFNMPASDILVSSMPTKKDAELPWITRQGDTKIMDIPFSVFSEGDTIYPYFEFQTDDFIANSQGKCNYLVSWYLHPCSESRDRRPVVEVGPIRLLKDSLEVRKLEKDLKKQGKFYFVFSSVETSGLPAAIFANPIHIPKEIPKGDYFLVASIEDANSHKGTSKRMLIWRRIAIKN